VLLSIPRGAAGTVERAQLKTLIAGYRRKEIAAIDLDQLKQRAQAYSFA
jgi:hypothetical protein